MKRKAQRIAGLPSLDLLEEATHLLRDLPLGAYLPYLLGAFPFWAALLYFWADMSHGAMAQNHCLPGALTVALAYLWMKTWHAVFVSSLKEHLTGLTGDPWTVRRWLRCLSVQAAFQPTCFLILPLASIVVLPFGWGIAFYQNLSWTGDGRDEGLRQTFARTWRVSCQWPGQNHLVLSWFTIFGFLVFVNVCLLFNFIPSMLKTFLGIETAWTQGGWTLANTTLWASCIAVAWVCLDPLIKSAYALRCFYGEALTTGEDLKAEIRSLQLTRRLAAGAVITLLWLCPGSIAADDSPSSPAATVTEELDKSIDEVLQQRRYEWRLPPDTMPQADAEQGWVQRILNEMLNSVVDAAKAVIKQIDNFIDWIRKLFPKSKSRTATDTGIDWMGGMRILLFVLLAAVAGALAVLFWRYWRRQQTAAILTAQAVPARPDLADENIAASDLPRNEWLVMAQEQIAAGNLRLALRALYLAELAHLGERELLKITRFKSNQEYVRELGRRARSMPEVLTIFGDTVFDFEKVWYGLHEVTPDAVGEYRRKVERILAC